MTVFDPSKVTVVYVLGGPGAGGDWSSVKIDTFRVTDGSSLVGKGTQCERLVEEFGFCHISGINPDLSVPMMVLIGQFSR